jgi:hypothetical protein
MNINARLTRCEKLTLPTAGAVVVTVASLTAELLAERPGLQSWLAGDGTPAPTRDDLFSLIKIPYSSEWYVPGDDVRALAQSVIVQQIVARRALDAGEPAPRDFDALCDFAFNRDPTSHCLLWNVLLSLVVCEAWAAGTEAVIDGEVVGNAFAMRGVLP